jgi:hypothetical protein
MQIFKDLLAILITMFIVFLILGVFISIGYGVGYLAGLIVHYVFGVEMILNKSTEMVFGLIGAFAALVSIFLKR